MNLLGSVNWRDLRIKCWHAALVLAAAYCAHDTRFAWALPVITAAAGMSTPPAANGVK